MARRRLLCIRPLPNPLAGPRLAATKELWIEALEQQAEVLALNSDFDLAAVAAAFRPDMIIFSALDWRRPWPARIANRGAHPEVPRVLYLTCGPDDPFRVRTLAMADEHRVEAIFVTSEAHCQLMPELCHRPVQVISQFVDDAIYKDYALPKTIPVSIFGDLDPASCEWRTRTMAALDCTLPVMTFPDAGHAGGSRAPCSGPGSAYARMINRSAFVIAATTRFDCVEPTHLEIPASGSILVAPDMPAFARYGFVDGVNCVLGDGSALAEKIADIARDPGRYEGIRHAGHELVHRRYTRESWTGFLDWFDDRSADDAAMQTGLARPPARTMAGSVVRAAEPETADVDAMARGLAAARDAILSGDDLRTTRAEARQLSSRSTAEQHFLLGIVDLLGGHAAAAASAIAQRAKDVAAIDRAGAAFDPVEAAWLLIIAHLRGDAETGSALRRHAAQLRHLCLRRALWFIDGAPQDGDLPDAALIERQPDDHLSVHWLGDEDFTLWSNLLTRVVRANGFSVPASTPSPAHRVAQRPRHDMSASVDLAA